jgi:hypothetical protein
VLRGYKDCVCLSALTVKKLKVIEVSQAFAADRVNRTCVMPLKGGSKKYLNDETTFVLSFDGFHCHVFILFFVLAFTVRFSPSPFDVQLLFSRRHLTIFCFSTPFKQQQMGVRRSTALRSLVTFRPIRASTT